MTKLRQGRVLVTGGAGYIGSHVALALRRAGRPAVVLDNLTTGDASAVPRGVPLQIGDVADRALVDKVIEHYGVSVVIHLAGSVIVPESLREPIAYYRNNTEASRTLIAACEAGGVEQFVFSSTAAVYGQPAQLPVAEDAPTCPLNPYGRSKLMTEWMLRDAGAAHGLRHVILRYFNVAGADALGRAGFSGKQSGHLIKVACETALGRHALLPIHGTDYPTRDGTCVRDFIHVTDLASAHVAALRYLDQGGESAVLNCGYGRGFSVREVVAAVETVIGRRLPVAPAPRRLGDAAEVVADVRRIRAALDWRPAFDDLSTIVAHTLARQQQGGYMRRLRPRATVQPHCISRGNDARTAMLAAPTPNIVV
ncbi:MAG: UDP-glucose 4-epimerase GalE [Geminicoccaceae bacterium]